MDYKTSGVDVQAGRAFIDRIKTNVQATYRKEVIGGLGGFGGLIRLPEGFKKPVLVSGTDGVGTKLELAQKYKAHHGVGIDLVAMCVNDVITTGAEPLFFLDYLATGTLSPEDMGEVVNGIADGCRLSGCALVGGETAEMPGFYPSGRYDLAGFCVGVIEETDLIDGSKIREGDQIIGIESSGLHSNGFSLVRKVLEMANANEKTRFGETELLLIRTLLEPTHLYWRILKPLLKADISIKGMAHITGGGLPENLPRCMPDGLRPFVDKTTWPKPEIFQWLQKTGQIPEVDLWNTFNLGIGFCLIVDASDVHEVLKSCSDQGFSSWPIGFVEAVQGPDHQLIRGLYN